MELLEREGPLSVLATARGEAAAGRGSVVLVAGEAGIGKTALMARFARDHAEDTAILWGTCDDLSIPRPLGPLRDLDASDRLSEALSSDAPIQRIHALLLDEIRHSIAPAALILEDVHWADEATVDVITVVGRRIRSLPGLLVLTYRTGELAGPLAAALDSFPADGTVHIQLEPLSREAVAGLVGAEADRIYAATGGNPFFVTEMAAALPVGLPPSVASAVLGRASRLGDRSKRLVEVVSMVPTRISTEILDIVMPRWAEAAEEPERRGLLEVESSWVRFRHDLARAAVRSSVPVARRRLLHGQILHAMLALGSEPADIVHHAEAAGDLDVVATHAVVAARRAAALDSNREAHAHYVRAAELIERIPLDDRSAVFEELAVSAYTVDRLPEAFPAVKEAIRLNRERGDDLSLGRCTRLLSRLHWYAGNGGEARTTGERAVTILSPLGDTAELALAYSNLSQLAMLSGQVAPTVEWGERAVALAEAVGDDSIKAHALVNIGSIRMQTDPDDTALLVEAHQIADRVGDRHEAMRALLNLAFSALAWARPQASAEYTAQATEYGKENQVDTLLAYVGAIDAWLALRRGDWDEAERAAGDVIEAPTSVGQILAETVLTELAVRRGDQDAADRLDGLAKAAQRTAELQRIGPVLQLQTEFSLTSDREMPREEFEFARGLMGPVAGFTESAVGAWAAVAGLAVAVDGDVPEPHGSMIRGDWAGAARAFSVAGWPYEQALMQSLLAEEGELKESISIARRLGAQPLAARVARKMTELGFPVPPAPRPSTMSNPAGLTPRQLQVLELLAEGLTNAEVAERLFVSNRTAEHHVEAILAKLGVSTRREAARRYQDLIRTVDG